MYPGIYYFLLFFRWFLWCYE